MKPSTDWQLLPYDFYPMETKRQIRDEYRAELCRAYELHGVCPLCSVERDCEATPGNSRDVSRVTSTEVKGEDLSTIFGGSCLRTRIAGVFSVQPNYRSQTWSCAFSSAGGACSSASWLAKPVLGVTYLVAMSSREGDAAFRKFVKKCSTNMREHTWVVTLWSSFQMSKKTLTMLSDQERRALSRAGWVLALRLRRRP